MAYLSTGVHPFAGRHQADWIRRVVSGQPNLSGLHQDVDAVVRAALAFHPHDRPSAHELTAICRARARQVSAPDPARQVSAPDPATRPHPAGRTVGAADCATSRAAIVGRCGNGTSTG